MRSPRPIKENVTVLSPVWFLALSPSLCVYNLEYMWKEGSQKRGLREETGELKEEYIKGRGEQNVGKMEVERVNSWERKVQVCCECGTK